MPLSAAVERYALELLASDKRRIQIEHVKREASITSVFQGKGLVSTNIHLLAIVDDAVEEYREIVDALISAYSQACTKAGVIRDEDVLQQIEKKAIVECERGREQKQEHLSTSLRNYFLHSPAFAADLARVVTQRFSQLILGVYQNFGIRRAELAVEAERKAADAAANSKMRGAAGRNSTKPRRPRKRQVSERRPTVKQMEAWVAYQEHGTVSKAARALGKDRKTVDQAIKSMLKYMGMNAPPGAKTKALPVDNRGQVHLGDDKRREGDGG